MTDRLPQFCNTVTFKAILTFQGFWNQVCSCSNSNLCLVQGKGLTSKTQGQQVSNSVTAMKHHEVSDRQKSECLPISKYFIVCKWTEI